MKKVRLLLLCGLMFTTAFAQKQFTLESPDGKLRSTITVGDELTYDISRDGKQVLATSPLGMRLDNGEVWGQKPKLVGSSKKSVDEQVNSPFYRTTRMRDHYNELTLRFKKDWSVEFRAYDDGVAYRFVNRSKRPFHVVGEMVDYSFPADREATVPYVRDKKNSLEEQFFNSFENTYVTERISKLDKERLIFLPLVVDAGDGVKVCITESDLTDYPGLYLKAWDKPNSLSSMHAPYPKKEVQGGHNRLQMVVTEREDYIAKVTGPRTFPWRIAIVTTQDKQLAESNLSYLLAAPSKLDDLSWIKPGKVAWDWWNDWNLDGVDFKTGVNNATYKAYIDFASAKGIEYVILDEGWAVNLQADLMQVVKDINLKELADYAASKNVGLILWAGYYAFERDMENVCRHYAEMGIKGFKVDFMDRDDQKMVEFNHRAAAMCAKYKLILDLHGMYKPAGLNRTYPNVLNFEGVHGLEQMKWSARSVDQMKYDVTIPFTRQVAGPMDYTQGAMRNATKSNYYPCYNEPMSQGTRCHQLALYMVLESPFNMLCDTPSNYQREPEATDFIVGIPTVWDETVVVDGKMGEYIVTARRKGDVWYIGGITDWTPRDLEVDCSFLGDKTYEGIMLKDGINADRIARDYKRECIELRKGSKLKVHLAPGGGFAIRVQ